MFIWTEQEIFNKEMIKLEETLSNNFLEGNQLLRKASRDIVLTGGKRIRPALVISSCMTKHYNSDSAIAIACAIEILHTATLVHDDVIDDAQLRRGHETISKTHGNKVAILTGDYLLSKALVMISHVDLPKEYLVKIARSIESMCSGEIAQHYSKNLIPSTRAYLKRIMQKTSLMFSTSCSLGAYLAGHDEDTIKKFGRLGLHLGTAFQIRDDLLDFDENSAKAGKPTQIDLQNGIVTLPFLIAAKDLSFRDKLLVFLEGDRQVSKSKLLINQAKELGGYEKAKESLNERICKCKKIVNGLEESSGKQILFDLIDKVATI